MLEMSVSVSYLFFYNEAPKGWLKIVKTSSDSKADGAQQRNVEAVLTRTDGIPLDEIDQRLAELQKELLKVVNAKGNWENIADEIHWIREARPNAQVDNAEHESMKKQNVAMQGVFLPQNSFVIMCEYCNFSNYMAK